MLALKPELEGITTPKNISKIAELLYPKYIS